MGPLLAVQFALCALSATGWAALAGWRAPGGTRRALLRGLAGGGAAFGLALGAYAALEEAGLAIAWEQVLAGGWPAARLALLIGLVEEGAKLFGIALAVERGGRGAAMRATVGVAASFAALEAALAAGGGATAAVLARALLAPVAHALLAAPLGFALSARPGRTRARALALALPAAAVLHAAGDLALSLPGYGRLGYAAALLAPALWAYLHLRRLAPRRLALAPPLAGPARGT
ncbi:MAG: PrsW family glutamic-type intramembrane protease [Anaeromyxobacter sp.]